MYTSSSENYSSSMRGSPSKWGNKDDKGYAYKKSSYQYSTAGNNSISQGDRSADKNIDQLDALLEDLKHERQITTRDKDLLSSSKYQTIERERNAPGGTITKTTRVIRTSNQAGSLNPPIDDIETFSTSDYSTLKSNGYSGLQRTLYDDDYQTKEKPYGSNNVYKSESKLYSSNRMLGTSDVVPTSSTTTSTHLEKDLQNLTLSEDILPIPGTKVTTTVRTYTYEVPAGTPTTNVINRSQYNTIQRNELNNTTLQSHPHTVPTVPQTVVYNTESYSTLNKNSERPIASNQIYEVREHRETNTLRNNLMPQPQSPTGPGGSTKTIVYNVNTTENVRSGPEFNNYPPHSPTNVHLLPSNASPHSPPHGPQPTTNRYYYKESSNVVNTIHGPGGPGGPVGPGGPGGPSEPHVHTIYNPPNHSPQKPLPTGYPPHGDGHPPYGSPNTSSVTYKYSSTTNSRRGPDYGTPSPNTTHLSPFPVDATDYPNGGPPQRVDDLMQSFGNADTVDKSDMITRKREVETSVATPNQHVPSINKAGKEVYYPPGHEMTLRREEMHAGSAGGGRWAKGSGMYEYESGYKSKTKTKSGGAMVPVCLPLCCAMPCSIM